MHDALPRMVRRSAIPGRTVGDAHGRERVKDRKGKRSWKKSPVSHGGESEVGKTPMRHGNPESNFSCRRTSTEKDSPEDWKGCRSKA